MKTDTVPYPFRTHEASNRTVLLASLPACSTFWFLARTVPESCNSGVRMCRWSSRRACRVGLGGGRSKRAKAVGGTQGAISRLRDAEMAEDQREPPVVTVGGWRKKSIIVTSLHCILRRVTSRYLPRRIPSKHRGLPGHNGYNYGLTQSLIPVICDVGLDRPRYSISSFILPNLSDLKYGELCRGENRPQQNRGKPNSSKRELSSVEMFPHRRPESLTSGAKAKASHPFTTLRRAHLVGQSQQQNRHAVSSRLS